MLLACAADQVNTPRGTPPGPLAGTTASGGRAGTDPLLGSAGSNSTLLPTPAGTGSPGGAGSVDTPDAAAGCVGTSVTAPPSSMPKVDIVWVVDASGSMLDEQMKIGANLAQFADGITKAQIDVRIVMLTTSAAIPVICPVTSPDPLANTPLANDPRYKFFDTRVDSNNPLDIAVSSFPMYSSFLRSDAATHFVFVTDDESRYKGLNTPAERATSFRADMMGLLKRNFTLHTIASEGPTACRDPNCMPDASTGICVFVMLGCGAAAPGATYYELATMTHGLTSSICQSDWNAIFKPLSAAVIASAPLPCNYQIPPSPAGQSLDPTKVNVRWSDLAMRETTFGKAANSGTCGNELGWYYDDAAQPKEVLLCPATCQRIAEGGTLNIAYGCATVVLN
jgi:hypothetical protein